MKTNTKNTPLLEVKNLSKYFISRHGVNRAVDNVSFRVDQGEIIGLIGQSGSGKSTIGNALMRLLSEVNGTVTLDGKVVSGKISKKRKKEFHRNVQMIFQDPHTALNEKRNIFSTIAEPLIVNKIINEKTNNFFKNYDQTIQTFELTFKKVYKKFEINLATAKKSERVTALKKAIEDLKVYNFSTFGEDKLEQAFSELLFAYFSNIAVAEDKIINILVKSQELMFNLYEDAKKKIETRDLPKDELGLIDAKKALETYVASFNDKEIDKKIVEAKKAIRSDMVEKHKETRRLIFALIKDRSNKIKFAKQLAAISKTKAEHQAHGSKISRLIDEIHALKHFLRHFFIVEVSDIHKLDDEIRESSDLHKTIELEILRLKDITLQEQSKNNTRHIAEIELLSKNRGKEITPDSAEIERLNEEIKKATEIFNAEKNKFLVSWTKEYEELTNQLHELSKHDKEIEKLHHEADKLFHHHLHIILAKHSKAEVKEKLELVKEKRMRLKARSVEEELITKSINQFEYILGIKKAHKIKKYLTVKKMILKRMVFDTLTQVGLKPEHAYRYPHEFSGGQKQRINIARALIMEPKLIVADEPIASLDVSIQAQVVNILIDLVRNKGISMIFIGHDLSIIEYLADSLLVMHLGRIVEKGYAKPIYKNPTHPYTKTLLDAIPKISNAAEPFKSIELDNKYLADYALQSPEMFEVEEHHLILANHSQFKAWTKKDPKTKKTSAVASNVAYNKKSADFKQSLKKHTNGLTKNEMLGSLKSEPASKKQLPKPKVEKKPMVKEELVINKRPKLKKK